jgi:hypothetical protein
MTGAAVSIGAASIGSKDRIDDFLEHSAALCGGRVCKK